MINMILSDNSNANKPDTKPFVIGLCGGIGSGKSEVGKILKQLNAYIIDSDKVSKSVTAEGTECNNKLKAAFLSCCSDGILQRALLKSYVFNNEKGRILLNSITHPYILAEIKQLIKGQKLVVIEVPLLFESGFDKLCDITVCVLADKKTRQKRVAIRDNMPANLIDSIINKQISDSDLTKKCDYVIKNNKDLSTLKQNVLVFYEKIKKLVG